MAFEYSCMTEEVSFHFLIDSDLWNKLAALDHFGKMVLKRAVAILELFYRTNRDLVCLAEDEGTKPEKVGKHHDVHIIIPREVYYWLKNTHGAQNVHGMAQLARAVLRYYVELVRKYGSAQGESIFTGKSTYRVRRAFVRIKRSLFPKKPTRFEYLTQLSKISCFCRAFVEEFVVLME